MNEVKHLREVMVKLTAILAVLNNCCSTLAALIMRQVLAAVMAMYAYRRRVSYKDRFLEGERMREREMERELERGRITKDPI